MKESLNSLANDARSRRTSVAAALTILCIAVTVAFLAMPVAIAREMSAIELLQSQLPAPKTLATATKAELLAAVCSAVKKSSKDAGQIVRAAIGTHKAPAADVVGQAITCLGKDKDCSAVGRLVHAGVKAAADETSQIVERALMLSPDCRDAIEQASRARSGDENAEGENSEEGNFTDGPVNQNPPPGSMGGGFGPQDNSCLVCHNGQEISMPCSEVPGYLANHPGDTSGACQVTPAANR